MKSEKIEQIKLIELLCMLTILNEILKEPTPIDEFKELSFKNVLG